MASCKGRPFEGGVQSRILDHTGQERKPSSVVLFYRTCHLALKNCGLLSSQLGFGDGHSRSAETSVHSS